MRHLLITGGAGFIGSHLCEALLSKGYAVTAIDNLVTGRKENLSAALLHRDFSFVEWDVCKPLPADDLPLLQRHGLHGVFHFACPASPVDFDRIPLEILAVDSVGTMNAVELALLHRARLILASTSEIYGDPLVHPQSEDYWGNVNTIGPRACYDETKRFAEAYVSSAARKEGLDARIVRIFNTYGPRMRPDDGRIVPELCMQALKGEPLTIHGQGRQTRSFCFVSDLVEGVIRLFESEVKQPVNIGNPSERTVMDFAQAVLKLTGSRSALRHLPERPDDPRRRCPDITRARTLLGWSPKVELETGLAACIDYFKNLPRA
ncbi:MAG: SDR family oxidoreductase [Oligoflexia bacterium]|nr:SDR family oxidoreductase [Oligoflexia bacterium]